jgi:hypothetical protein
MQGVLFVFGHSTAKSTTSALCCTVNAITVSQPHVTYFKEDILSASKQALNHENAFIRGTFVFFK